MRIYKGNWAGIARGIEKKPCLIIDEVTGEIFGRLAADLDGRETPSTHRVNDVWIAALAVQHGMTILTQNEKVFSGYTRAGCRDYLAVFWLWKSVF